MTYSTMTPEQKQRAKERHANWRQQNREKLRLRNAQWRASDPDYFKRYQEKNQTSLAIKRKQYADANRLKKRESDRAYGKLNREKLSQKVKDWISKNRERHRASGIKWKNHNRASVNASNHKRRALQRKASINLKGIKEFFAATKSKKLVICYYCQQKILSSACHFDHIVPLAKGGQHSVENLCVSCPCCNVSKNSTLLQSWKKLNQIVFPI